MAGTYFNVIRELIYQSELNTELLNDINNYFNNSNDEETGIKDKHLRRVERKYQNEVQQPRFDYFDGTQLINTLFSQIVIPIGFIKGRYEGQITLDERMMDVNDEAYAACLEIIGNIAMENRYVNTYTHNLNLYDFLTHVRNSLCNSINGKLHFFFQNNEDRARKYILF